MLLRPGSTGSNTAADHIAVLAAATRQIPAAAGPGCRLRADGADATHELIEHLPSQATARLAVLFTAGWADAWPSGLG